MNKKLPKVLGREPLIDALFEVRFKQSSAPLADVLPGFLFGRLTPKPKIQRLPAAELPAPIRASDPGLKYAPIQRLDWGSYFISIGDGNIIINCKLPYPKWPDFKKTILDVVGNIRDLKLEGAIERYSLKYINLIPAKTNVEQVERIKMEITLGNIKVLDEDMTLQVHHHEADIIHILTVIIGAQTEIPGTPPKHGAVVDVDSIRNVNAESFDALAKDLESGLEELRKKNKAMFFSCLKDAAIAEMEPQYD